MNPNNNLVMPHSHKTLIIVLIACIIIAAIFFSFFYSNKIPSEHESDIDVAQNQDTALVPKKLNETELMSMMDLYSTTKTKPVTDKQRQEFFRLAEQNNTKKLTREQLLEMSRLYSNSGANAAASGVNK